MSSKTDLTTVDPKYVKENRGDTLLAICGALIVVETLLVVLRYYARNLTTSSFGWDDAIVPAAWLTNVGLAILCIGQYSQEMLVSRAITAHQK